MKALRLPLLFCLVSGPALAQTPDTTASWRYLPLEVGNVWEYERWLDDWRNPPARLLGYERHAVTGDSVIAGHRYFQLLVDWYNEKGGHTASIHHLLRFDTTSATVREYSLAWETEEIWEDMAPCALDAPFDGIWEGDEHGLCYLADMSGGYEEQVAIGEDVVVTAFKHYEVLYHPVSVAADIGVVYMAWYADFGPIDFRRLRYARVGGTEYGEPLRVSAEGGAVPQSAAALALYPNPVRGAATATFALDRPQRVRIEAFDLLGRRVLADDLGALAAGEHARQLDAAALPAGVYLVRIDGSAGASATARIVRL